MLYNVSIFSSFFTFHFVLLMDLFICSFNDIMNKTSLDLPDFETIRSNWKKKLKSITRWLSNCQRVTKKNPISLDAPPRMLFSLRYITWVQNSPPLFSSIILETLEPPNSTIRCCNDLISPSMSTYDSQNHVQVRVGSLIFSFCFSCFLAAEVARTKQGAMEVALTVKEEKERKKDQWWRRARD